MIGPNSKVLVVDDYALVRTILRQALLELKIESVTEAADGESGLVRLKESLDEKRLFDLIFCDWQMPKMTGLEVLKAIRRNPAYQDIPFIFVTSETEHKFVIEALKQGATDYLVKPFTQQIFAKKIEVLNREGKTSF